MIKALIVDKADDDSVSASISEIEASQLPDDGEVDIAVEYSTINYKDGLCLNGLGRLVRNYPHVPGIDLAGTVISSRAKGITEGDRVTMNGFRSGEVLNGLRFRHPMLVISIVASSKSGHIEGGCLGDSFFAPMF